MAGYSGNSMSNNAVSAYNNNEMPLSKWTKKQIIEVVENLVEFEDINFKMTSFKKLKLDTLKKEFLKYASWHHTSSFYNETEFYNLDEQKILSLTNDCIEKLIEENKTKRVVKTPEQKLLEKTLKEEKINEKYLLEEKKKLISYQKKYKKIKTFLERSTDESIAKLRSIRNAKIENKKNELLKIWETQNYEYGLNMLKNKKFNEYSDFVEIYIKDSDKLN